MKHEIRYNKRLKGMIEEKGITQKQLALDSGVPAAYISRIIRGKQIPTDYEMEAIASILEVEVKDIF